MKRLLILSCVALTMILGGCSNEYSGRSYKARSVGSVDQVMRGTIVSEDIVDIEKDRGIGAGAAIGGAAGALAGSAFGKGEGKILTTAAGALLGGTAGHFAQRSKNYKCVRYVIKLDNRNTICIVQGLDDTGMIPVGTRVYVTIDSAGKGKVFPMDR